MVEKSGMQPGPGGISPLHVAVTHGWQQLVSMLIEKGMHKYTVSLLHFNALAPTYTRILRGTQIHTPPCKLLPMLTPHPIMFIDDVTITMVSWHSLACADRRYVV